MNSVSVPDITQSAVHHFELVSNSLPGNQQVADQRRKAFEYFINKGFPQRSDEEYKYSGTEKIFKDHISWANELVQNSKIDFEQIKNQNKEVDHLFIVNGELIDTESALWDDNNSLLICDIKTAAVRYPEHFSRYYGNNVLGFDDAFAQLNTGIASNGLFILVPPGMKVTKPIQINYIACSKVNVFLQVHNLLVVENNAQISVIESYSSASAEEVYALNVVSEIFVGENATTDFYRLQNENQQAVHINATQVVQEKSAYFDTHTVTLGGRWVRNNLNIKLNGLHGETHLNGLQLLSGQQHVDNHTLVDHRMPHCNSNQLYKGILKDKSTGVFNGKIFVRKDAQKTNAYQSSKNMLLSDDATMNTKPQLEIYADDVKCSHGSSTGQIDQNALFYLRSRALSEEKAKSLLMYAFAKEVIEKVKIESYKNYLETLIENSFE